MYPVHLGIARELSTTQSQKLSFFNNSSVAFETSQETRKNLPTLELFVWTLTHPSRAFSDIKPIFNSRNDLLSSLTNYGRGYQKKITEIALRKVTDEWAAWVNVHADMGIDECGLDNMLMRALYSLIIERDNEKCAQCDSSDELTIHHIIPKQRNMARRLPPFGRSVPTNLITLCRSCHSNFDVFVANDLWHADQILCRLLNND